MLQRRILVLSGLLFVLLLAFNTSAFAKIYTVKNGDSLYTVAKKTGVSIDNIKKINHLSSKKLKPGQVLQISSEKNDTKRLVKNDVEKSNSHISSITYKIKKGDTLESISKKTGVPVKHIAALNDINSKKLRVGRQLKLAKSTPSVIPATLVQEDDDMEEDDGEEGFSSPDLSGNFQTDARTNEELLGMWGSADERKLFVKVATGFLGAPYRFGGATVKGIDCSAFVRKMYEFFDISLPRTAREQSAIGVRIERDKLEEGDLVFFRTKKPIGHVGIYIGNNKFLHASYKGKAVRIDSLDHPYFQERFQHAVRIKGLHENSGT